MKIIDAVKLAQQLLQKKSITPSPNIPNATNPNDGAIELLKSTLEKLGFECYIIDLGPKRNYKYYLQNQPQKTIPNPSEEVNQHRFPFQDLGKNDFIVRNLYAEKKGSQSTSKNICFAGHTDVVPPGNEKSWIFPPFDGHISNLQPQSQQQSQPFNNKSDNENANHSNIIIPDILYGRGAVDMKSAIACFISAVSLFLQENQEHKHTLSFMITGDEEGDATYGTQEILKWLAESQTESGRSYYESQNENSKQNERKKINQSPQKLDYVIVGEPTNPNQIGEMIKIGRRGSVNFSLTIKGKQGHVAYPQNANNPIKSLIKILDLLNSYEFDQGNQYFDPTNLEITDISTNNPVTNVIPAKAQAKFNIRFNNHYTSQAIINNINDICATALGENNYILEEKISGESFLNKESIFSEIISNSIKEITNITPELSTTGGTSDARFITKYANVVEFGLVNTTAHQTNEHVPINDLKILTKIYHRILNKINIKL